MNFEEVLSSWLGLNNALRKATEKECEGLLKYEREHRKRLNVLLRVHGRYNLLRAERERIEILTSISKKGK